MKKGSDFGWGIFSIVILFGIIFGVLYYHAKTRVCLENRTIRYVTVTCDSYRGSVLNDNQLYCPEKDVQTRIWERNECVEWNK